MPKNIHQKRRVRKIAADEMSATVYHSINYHLPSALRGTVSNRERSAIKIYNILKSAGRGSTLDHTNFQIGHRTAKELRDLVMTKDVQPHSLLMPAKAAFAQEPYVRKLISKLIWSAIRGHVSIRAEASRKIVAHLKDAGLLPWVLLDFEIGMGAINDICELAKMHLGQAQASDLIAANRVAERASVPSASVVNDPAAIVRVINAGKGRAS